MSSIEQPFTDPLSVLNLDESLKNELRIAKNRIQNLENQKDNSDLLNSNIELVISRHEEWELKSPEWKSIWDFQVKDIFEPVSQNILEELGLVTPKGTLHPNYNLSPDLATVQPVFENADSEIVSIEFSRLGFLYLFLKADNIGVFNLKKTDELW